MSSLAPSSPTTPPLRIDISAVDKVYKSARVSVEVTNPSPTTPRNPPLSPFLGSPNSEKPPASPSWPKFTAKPSRARNESQKLLAHLLTQLQNRPMPVPIFDAFKNQNSGMGDRSFGVVLETVRGAVRMKAGKRDGKLNSQTLGAFEDEDEDEDVVFSTDVTYDLMMQLKEVLIISVAQGWHIFQQDASQGIGERRDRITKSSSPFRRSRNSLQPGGRRSRSPSPAARSHDVQAPELLSQCISVLASIVSEDCRFKVALPRPSRPPNALQALTLDVAQFLLHTHRHDPKIVSQIGFAIIPALATFHPEMHIRLLTFFEDGVLRGVLEELRLIQGVIENSVHNDLEFNTSVEPPIVSIQVDEFQEESSFERQATQSWIPWSSSMATPALTLQSTNAPLQPPQIYYLSSLVPPLLSAIMECVDLAPHPSSRVEVLHRFYHLLEMVMNAKPDTYLDILEVVAYHSPKARHLGVSLLATLWPRAIGHLVVTKPLPISTYFDSSNGQAVQRLQDHSYTHQFVPWRFTPHSNRPGFEGMSNYECRSCSIPIRGFGLFCPFCMCGVHFDCYDDPEGCHVMQYDNASDPNIQKIAMYRFSFVAPKRRDVAPNSIRRNKHSFQIVNLFTLALCFVCRKPLWGCTMQGMECSSCLQFAHSSCLSDSVTDVPRCGSTRIDSNYMTITWTDLRLSCIDHYDILLSEKDDVAQRTYEEVSIFLAVLWTQLQILLNGVAMGSIVVMQKGKDAANAKHKVDEFELQRVVSWCEELISSGVLSPSVTTQDYLQENPVARSDCYMMFDWSGLLYISSTIKSPFNPQKPLNSTSSDLLNVTSLDPFQEQSSETTPNPFEIVSLAHMRDVLGYELRVFSDTAARFLLSHLHQLGFFDRVDSNDVLFDDTSRPNQTYCVFPLPLGLDISTDVETLVSAIEACLSDLDLSVNEVGFLLLVRRLWPNGMSTEYASRRLTRNVLSWILAEDDSLATILRDYLAKQQALPGVRSGADPLAWPSSQNARPAPASSNNGGDYVAARRALLSRYAVRWLLALHDQDPRFYAELVYDLCVEFSNIIPLGFRSDLKDKKNVVKQLDKTLRSITRLAQNYVMFTEFDGVFLRWLESVSFYDLCHEHMPALHRLFPRETEISQRPGTIIDLGTALADGNGSISSDPWRIVLSTASTSRTGLLRSLQWLCLFARSGIEIPISIYLRFSTLTKQFDVSLADSLLLVEALMSSIWLKSIGRQELQTVFTSLHSRLASRVLEGLQSEAGLSDILRFIRLSLATCLLLYGCERQALISLELIAEAEIHNLPSRRKLNSRGSIITDPIIMDPGLMNVLERYSNAGNDEVSCLIAKFLNSFITESSFLEPYEVDNFILRNGKVLCTCAWQFYEIQRHDISKIRTTFLLRILVVDAQPLQAVLNDWCLPIVSWEIRLQAMARLFRIILEVTSPAFTVENRQWRSSVIDVFYVYFTALWADEREEIRLAVDTWSQTLLPPHLDAISLCWNESLATAPISERVKLVSFLIQLRPHFSEWKVLSWDVIIETLVEDDYSQKNGDDEDGPASAHLSMYGISHRDEFGSTSDSIDPDMAMLRVSLILLSLQMIADGITVDTFTLLKIKLHLVQVVGFNNVSVVPAPSGHSFNVRFGEVRELPDIAFPCVVELLTVLDAPHPFDLSSSAMGGPYTEEGDSTPLLVGSIFVDVSLGMLCHIKDLLLLPVLVLKSLLESLIVIIHKHDFESRPLKYLQNTLRRAVVRALELLLLDISYEIRQIALSVVQAFVKRWPSFMGSLVYMSIESTAKLIASLSQYGQDPLVVQARLFIESTLTTYSNGLFISLCKRPLDQEFFVVLKQVTESNAKGAGSSESLRDALLRDTLARALDNDQATFQVVLNNLRDFVEVVYHQGYSAELMQFVGHHLTLLARRTSEWAADAVDPTPLLMIPSLLMQFNKLHSRDMLMYTDTVLRVALNRLNVNTASLSRLVHVTTNLYRKVQPRDPTGQSNNIVMVIFEILADGLRMKARVLPSTLTSMIETLTTADIDGSATLATTHLTPFLGLVDNGLHFLQHHNWADVHSDSDFTASMAVAKMVLEAATHDTEIMARFSDQGQEKRLNLGVRAWNILALAALSDPMNKWGSMLFAQLPVFSIAHFSSLRFYIQSGTRIQESATTDINHAYVSIKLWLMLAQRENTTTSAGTVTALAVWNELWPPFESLMNILEAEAQIGTISTLTTLVWSSVADLFLFTRHLHSPLALETGSQITTLNRLRRLASGDSSGNKITRVLRNMSAASPVIPFEVLVSQAAKDIMAAEKIRILEAKRELGRTVQERRAPERHRRDG